MVAGHPTREELSNSSNEVATRSNETRPGKAAVTAHARAVVTAAVELTCTEFVRRSRRSKVVHPAKFRLLRHRRHVLVLYLLQLFWGRIKSIDLIPPNLCLMRRAKWRTTPANRGSAASTATIGNPHVP